MRAAYADPPYPGQARKHYRHEVLCAEVDHAELIGAMCIRYDCWALSTSSTALQDILPLCPAPVRIGAWVKPFASFKPGVNPAYAWEPVIVWNSRPLGRDVPTVRDWVAANITLRKGLAGAKPPAFCQWLFRFMGLSQDDELTDLFPGTEGVGRQWQLYKRGEAGHIQMEAARVTPLRLLGTTSRIGPALGACSAPYASCALCVGAPASMLAQILECARAAPARVKWSASSTKSCAMTRNF